MLADEEIDNYLNNSFLNCVSLNKIKLMFSLELNIIYETKLHSEILSHIIIIIIIIINTVFI